jgi:hypothetical protein
MKQLLLTALALTPLFGAMPALAADQAPPESQGEHRRREPSAEEKARHEARKKAWEAMTPEEREAKMKERQARHEARKKEWEAMTPEQREAKKQEMKDRGGDRPHGQRPSRRQ